MCPAAATNPPSVDTICQVKSPLPVNGLALQLKLQLGKRTLLDKHISRFVLRHLYLIPTFPH